MNSLSALIQTSMRLMTKMCQYLLICAILFLTVSTAAHCADDSILTPEEHRWLNDNNSRIVLAVETGYPPYTFLDSKGKPSGLAHDYLLLLESKFGIRFIQKQFSSLDEIFSKVRVGKIHIVNAVTKTPDRSEFLLFTDPFISVPNVIVVRKDRPGELHEKDLAGLKVSLVKSYAITEYLLKAETGLIADIVPNDLTAILNVSFGQSDAAIIDLATASWLISEKGIANLRVAGEASRSIQLSMAVPRSEAMLQSILKKGLNAIPDEERHKIQEKWIHTSKWNIFTDWRFWAFVGGALCIISLLIIGSFVWNKMLRRQVALHTSELAKEQEAVRQSESRHRVMVESITDVIAIIDQNGINRYKSPNIEKLFGWQQDEVIGQVTWKHIHPDDLAATEKIFADLLGEANRLITSECRYQCKDGSYKWIEFSAINLLHDPDISGVLLSYHDITERKQTEKVLRESDERFSVAFNNAPIMISISSLEDGIYLDVNQRFLNTCGFSREEVIGKTSIELGWISAADLNMLKESMLHDGRVVGQELGLRTKSGKSLICKFWGELVSLTGQKRLLSIAVDITEQRDIERQFLQAQKMESVGRLAGGVAHDFNNMLGIIIGHSELALIRGALPDAVRTDLQEILQAAERSAEITKQLLAFSRQQLVQPKVLDLNDVISGMIKMLRRLIGEDIELSWNAGYGIWKVRIDQAQVDQILANLCVNARDAIADTGRIVIQTENVTLEKEYADVTPGDYVMLAVSDNGAGMSSEVMEHIYEPFYTTKDVGHGTGLGLATVFGIVKQNNGHINVYSEPGQGTVFRIYLSAEKDAVVDQPKDKPNVIGGSEVILVVEDEPSILQMIRTMLTTLGYKVFSANTPEEAKHLAVSCQNKIDLLITDVIMPGMNGRDLAEQLMKSNQKIKCLYMSGYTADILADRGRMEERMRFLQKPFNLQLLSEKVREVLDDK